MSQPPDQPFGDEEALLRALRAPGSAGELDREEEYAAMFRAAQGSPSPAVVPLAPRRRRAVSRFGAGSAFVVVLAVGGSAAAAYTNNLPEPIQRFAHRALGPVAPPAPPPQRHRATDHATTAATVSATPSPSSTPTSTPTSTSTSRPSHSPSHSPKPTPSATPTPTATPTATPTPTSTPTSTPTPTPSTTPTPTPTPTSTPTLTPPVVPAAVSISGSTHKVEVGQSVAFAGVVTSDDGSAVRRAKVMLQTFSGSWTTVSSARTDGSGAVSLVLPPVAATTGVRLRAANGVHSARWRVTLHPSLAVTSAPAGSPGSVVITATALGGQSGDTVQLLSKDGQVGGTLSGGQVSFTVTPTTRRTKYVVLLPGTSAHGPDHATITVIVKKPAGGGPSPGPSPGR